MLFYRDLEAVDLHLIKENQKLKKSCQYSSNLKRAAPSSDNWPNKDFGTVQLWPEATPEANEQPRRQTQLPSLKTSFFFFFG